MTQGNNKTDFRRKIQDKHIEDNFPAQHFQNAFQIGLFRVSLDPNEVLVPQKLFSRRGHPNCGKYYTAISK